MPAIVLLRAVPRGAALVLLLGAITAQAQERPFQIVPEAVQLSGALDRVQLVVAGKDAAGAFSDRSPDKTKAARFVSSDPAIVEATAGGGLIARGNGMATISVEVEGVTAQVPVTVAGVEPQAKPEFLRDVLPILSKSGCNMGACHAAQHGKGGFKLSVFGFEPSQDWQQIVRDRWGRRVDANNPAASLFLRKPTLDVAHGGGKRFAVGSVEHQTLVAWLQSGAAGPRNDAPQVKQLVVTPPRRVGSPGFTQQLRVEAEYSDGAKRDVTALAKFDSMDDGVLAVDAQGHVTALGKGQAPVMVRFEGQAAIAMFVVPFADGAKLEGWQSNNFIDELAAAKFRELGLEPSPLCDDATFLRRAYLDAIGTLPTPEETIAFLAATDPNKRNYLIDRLLGLTGDPAQDIYNDQYAATWTLKWSDLIRNNSNSLGEQGMWAMHNWIKESFRVNRPFDQFVRELVTGKGSIFSSGPANYFRIHGDSSALTEATAQLFLGVRLECAKCHHHPFEKYSQSDYYGFAAFFARVGTKGSQEFGLFGGESVVVVQPSGDVRHPRSGEVLPPTPLEGVSVENPLDRRIALADWLAAKDNPFFARSVVNRYLGYLLGRGLVEPVDDIRSTNPPSNPELMDALAKDFAEHGYNLKHLVRTIMASRLYQLSSQPTEQNAADRRFYSHYKVKRLAAEPLLDAVDQVTGVRTKFPNLPAGTRAIELPDAEYPDYFLNTFAKPRRASVCECERTPDENLAQALHTLNGDVLANKIADGGGRVARLVQQGKPHEEIVRELYLATLCRPPTDAELAASGQFLQESPSPRECYEDLLWALLNSKQFLYVR